MKWSQRTSEKTELDEVGDESLFRPFKKFVSELCGSQCFCGLSASIAHSTLNSGTNAAAVRISQIAGKSWQGG